MIPDWQIFCALGALLVIYGLGMWLVFGVNSPLRERIWGKW